MMLAFINLTSPGHLLIIGLVALLLFGNRLPEVARSLGRAFHEFKRGLRDVQDEMSGDDDSKSAPRQRLDPPHEDRQSSTADENEPVSRGSTTDQREAEPVARDESSRGS